MTTLMVETPKTAQHKTLTAEMISSGRIVGHTPDKAGDDFRWLMGIDRTDAKGMVDIYEIDGFLKNHKYVQTSTMDGVNLIRAGVGIPPIQEREENIIV